MSIRLVVRCPVHARRVFSGQTPPCENCEIESLTSGRESLPEDRPEHDRTFRLKGETVTVRVTVRNVRRMTATYAEATTTFRGRTYEGLGETFRLASNDLIRQIRHPLEGVGEEENEK